MPAQFGPRSDVEGFSWHAPRPPAVFTVSLCVRPEPFATGFSAMLGRATAVATRRIPCGVAAPAVLSIAIGRPVVRVRSFAFAEPAEPSQPPPSSRSMAARVVTTRLPHATRIRPPGDVVKLEDRLRYLLQPSLEVLLAERSLDFPCRPFPHQLEGVAFLFPRQAAILADEMGLGKTMQAITAIRLLVRSGEIRNALLICPKPLVSNWQREFDLWAPEIPVAVIDGDQARRRWQWQLTDVSVKIANYELLCRDRQVLEGDGPDQAIHFDLVALDEAQRVKNRASVTSQSARGLSRSRSWALTGTPVENSPQDLVGIFEFLAPGLISDAMRPRRMGSAVSDHVLRRTKEEVLEDLPPKLFRDAKLELSPQQWETYRLAEEEGVLRLNELGEGLSIQHVFELVLRLKQICNFDPATKTSSKLDRLEADLEEVAASGRKAIVFSQWVRTLEELARRLRRFGPLEYHGRISPQKRETVIQHFREAADARVLLISYGAGGVGLNLQFANYVFLFDRWWNPAVEDQAINRAHRIGVSAPVIVTRMLTIETIEEQIDRILEEKRELFATIFSGAKGPAKLGLTQQELFGLFNLKFPSETIRNAA